MKTLENQLADYCEYQSELHGPISAAEVMAESGPSTSVLELIEGSSRVVDRRRYSARRWPLAVIAAAAAAVILAIVLFSSLREETGPEIIVTDDVELPVPLTSLSPTLPADIPPELESGSIALPEGSARWVHLAGDETSLPGGDAIPWPSGFAVLERPEVEYHGVAAPAEVIRPYRLWVSPDGLDWQVESLPAPPRAPSVQLSRDEGVYWLVTSGPQLWRSVDAEVWEEVDLTDVVPDGPAGLDWNIELGTPVSVGTVTAANATFTAAFPFADYVETASELVCADMRPVPGTTDVYTLFDHDEGPPEECPTQREVQFVEDTTGLRVLDNRTGAELGHILGADLSHVARIQGGTGFVDRRIIVIDGGELSVHVPPFPDGFQRVELLGGEGELIAVVQVSSPDFDAVTVWRSNDGATWTEAARPSFLADVAQDTSIGLSSVLGGPVVIWVYDHIDAIDTAWESRDGVTWMALPGGLPDAPPPDIGWPDGTTAVRLASGWFANDGSKGSSTDGDDWWMWAGDEWVSLDEIGIEGSPDIGGGGIGSTAVGNTTIFYRANTNLFGNDRDMWILSTDSD